MTKDEFAALRERARVAAVLDLERRKTYIFGGDAADRVTCPGCRAWLDERIAAGDPPL